MNKSLQVVACVALFELSGCAAQLGGSAQHHGPGRSGGGAFDIEGRFVPVLGRDGYYASGHVVIADPDEPQPLGIRRGSVGGGYRWIDDVATVELGGELGGGEPTHQDYDGMGLYGGAVSALFFRLYGDQDREPGFAAVGVVFDLGALLRTGVWLPPFDSSDPVIFERSVQGALRITIISDLLDVSGEEIER